MAIQSLNLLVLIHLYSTLVNNQRAWNVGLSAVLSLGAISSRVNLLHMVFNDLDLYTVAVEKGIKRITIHESD